MDWLSLSGEDGDLLPSAPPMEILDRVAGYEDLSFDAGKSARLTIYKGEH